MIIDDIVYGLERLAKKHLKESLELERLNLHGTSRFEAGRGTAFQALSAYVLRLAETTPELGQYFTGEDSGKEIDLG